MSGKANVWITVLKVIGWLVLAVVVVIAILIGLVVGMCTLKR